MSQAKTQIKKPKKEIGQRLRNAKLTQAAIDRRQFGKGAFHEMDVDDWSLGQIEAERNILERDVEP